ncbi:urea ABC transporter permease subunit UrtB [Vibrio albus]|uniref:Urea ABC transporter permease subunit UrtB n=1 Tax=Vibrio albus TaxID=2200953 RepID=A0A2U3B950_9VIBR|nr:urea ABC transporter permease subunit UrtB [Vibrio albus]PWI33320.1 urea ABC transporter permease subunit UrtB [Vibrio albus]
MVFATNIPLAGARHLLQTAVKLLVLFLLFSRAISVHAETTVSAQSATEQDTQFNQALQYLVTSKFSDVEKGVSLLGQSNDPRSTEVLTLLLSGDLYRHKKEQKLVTIQGKQDNKYVIQDLFTKDATSSVIVSKRKVKRVPLNNQLRGQIKSELARLNLSSPEADIRRNAVTQLMGTQEATLYQRLTSRLDVESDASVKELISVAVAIYELNAKASSSSVKQHALQVLGESYQPEARNAINRFVSAGAEGVLLKEANKALGLIEQRAKVAEFSQTLFFGLSLGSVLVLSAIGLAITFGVMGVINMAHGELMMLGAYTTYVIQTLMPDSIGASIFVSIPAAFLVSAAVGILIERGVIRFLYGRPLETLLATFGISLVLQQAVRTIFSPLNRSVATPDFMTGVIEINPLLSLTLNRLYIIGFCLVVFAALFFILRYTRLGIEVRAVSQNRSMARAMGVRSEWVDAMTFGLGSGIAGIAGVALSQLTNVGPNLGQAYIIDSFMVVVFGGVGNLWGTLVAGMSLGIANKVMEPWAGAVLAKILVLVFIILFIQKKPRGLFPQKGRSAEG